MDRRVFLKVSGAALAGLALSDADALAAGWGRRDRALYGRRPKGHFTLKQLSSVTDTIGNSYLLRTAGGKVIMVDGGFDTEAEKLREHLVVAGNRVDLWFISHPHNDHMGALDAILRDRRGLSIGRIIHSRVPDAFLDLEQGHCHYARLFYQALDNLPGETDVVDLHTTGGRFDIDGIGIMVLGVANPEFRTNPYNNQSLILRFWDDNKSVVLLGDAGVECGDKVLARYREYLDCDYLQMAHHGQSGCSEPFYKAVSFRACLWPTPSWVWEPAADGPLKTRDTRRWMDEKGIAEHHVSCLEKDWMLL